MWVVGDVHGAHDKLRTLLLGARLITEDGSWSGGTAHLAFLGDYLDRGPDGLGVVQLVRGLEAGARAAGGQVTALLGNHEVMFLAALHFARRDPHDRHGFRDYWRANGGQPGDAARVTPEDLAWLLARPALARAGRWLLLHADTPMYLRLGGSLEAVNARVAGLLGSHDPHVWGTFANAFADRFAFAAPGGERAAQSLLDTFGGERLAHGHTPVPLLLGESLAGPEDGSDRGTCGAGAPLLYAGGRCLALDSALAYRPQAGFLARLNGRGVAQVVTYGGAGETVQQAGPGGPAP
nr:metallophosphoesterase [Deinococcus budaensis]